LQALHGSGKPLILAKANAEESAALKRYQLTNQFPVTGFVAQYLSWFLKYGFTLEVDKINFNYLVLNVTHLKLSYLHVLPLIKN